MAKYKSFLKIRGRLGNIVFCVRNGKVYMRSIDLDEHTERIKNEPSYAEFRNCSTQMGRASKLASIVYPAVKARKEKWKTFGKVTRAAYRFIREGKTDDEVVMLVKREFCN